MRCSPPWTPPCGGPGAPASAPGSKNLPSRRSNAGCAAGTSRTGWNQTSRTAMAGCGTCNCSTLYPQLNSWIGPDPRCAPRGIFCWMCAPSCIGWPAEVATCCERRTLTRSLPPWVSVTGSTWPEVCPERRGPVRRPLDEGVVEHGGEVALARDIHPARDPALALRVAAAAARTGMPVATSTLTTLADTAPELRRPWPRQALEGLLSLLGAGQPAIDVIEAMDRTGLWGRLFPEWGAVRDLPPRDRVHVWTVDRHLVETAAQAARLTTTVARPDLLLLGALLHDLGKGRGGDHSIVGAALAEQIGHRLR